MLSLSTILTAIEAVTVRTPEILAVFNAATTALHPDDSATAKAAIEAHFAQEDSDDDALQARLADAAKR